MIEYGVCFRDIHTVEKFFVVCCILHNMMLNKMETETHDSTTRVGRGAPLGMDLIWLQSNIPTSAATEGSLALRKANKLAKAWAKVPVIRGYHNQGYLRAGIIGVS